jgi:hypothetical protein
MTPRSVAINHSASLRPFAGHIKGCVAKPSDESIGVGFVFGDKPFRGNEKTGEGEPFMERQVRVDAFVRQLKAGQ